MSVFANPRIDKYFKLLFGREGHKHLLISLLNSLLDLSDKYEGDDENSGRACTPSSELITDITLDPTEFVKLGGDLYEPICDIRCTTNTREIVIIEIQNYPDTDFAERMDYYQSRALLENVKAGPKKWPHVYLLAICSKTQTGLQAKEPYYAHTILQGARTLQKDFNNKRHMRVYNLDQFSKANTNIQFSTNEDTIKHQWLHFLNNCVNETVVPTDVLPVIREAFELMRHGNPKLDAVTIQLRHEEEITEQATAEGILEGKEIGREEGIQIGEARGREEERRTLKLQMLRKIKELIEKNWTTEQIIDVYFMFDEEEIDGVRTHLQNHSDCPIEQLAEALRTTRV